jgi:FdhD protein
VTIKDTMRTKLTIDKSSENEEGIRTHKLIVRGPDTSFESSDQIAEEKAVAMVYNGISHAVMMATPLNLEDLALGFSLTEGIINDKSQFYSVDIVRSELGFECQIEVPSAVFMSLKQRRRYLSGRTGCGICGLESLEAVAPDLRLIKPSQNALRVNHSDEKDYKKESQKNNSIKPLPNKLPTQLPATQLPSFDMVDKALKQLQDQQELRAKCGAVHAAALADRQGNIVLLREDVGRHNALDKLLGSQANSAREYKESFIVISSRASYEMIYKTAVIGIKTLVAASAPTAMAIELAQQANMNLIGFVREGRQLIYCQAR